MSERNTSTVDTKNKPMARDLKEGEIVEIRGGVGKGGATIVAEKSGLRILLPTEILQTGT